MLLGEPENFWDPGNPYLWTCRYYIILVGYAQTAAVGSVLMIGSTVYTELSERSGHLSFDRNV